MGSAKSRVRGAVTSAGLAMALLAGLQGCGDDPSTEVMPSVPLPPVSLHSGPEAEFLTAGLRLRAIGFALGEYHTRFDRLPPAVSQDAPTNESGWSWRVALLEMTEVDPDFLATNEFRRSEPWDSEHNLKVARNHMPPIFAPPPERKAEPGMTYFRVFVGPGTPFPDDGKPVTLEQIQRKDGADKTIVVVEADKAVLWTDPAELVLSDRTDFASELGGLYNKNAFWALTGDGTVRWLNARTDPKTLRALFTWNDGVPLKAWSDLEMPR